MSSPQWRALNVPNLLTYYRLLMAPVLVILALSELRTFFIIFLCISFVTDALDGPIARAWNLCTELGSRLDSIADTSTYVAALIGIFQFEGQALKPHISMLYGYLGVLLIATLVPLIKYKKIASFHIYSSKLNAILLAFLVIYIIVFDFNVYFYYFVLAFGIISYIEIISITFVLKEPVADVKGLYWILLKKESHD